MRGNVKYPRTDETFWGVVWPLRVKIPIEPFPSRFICHSFAIKPKRDFDYRFILRALTGVNLNGFFTLLLYRPRRG